jgi:hypothetical protein
LYLPTTVQPDSPTVIPLLFSPMYSNVFDRTRQHLCPLPVPNTSSSIIRDALCIDVGIVSPTSHCSHRNVPPLFLSLLSQCPVFQLILPQPLRFIKGRAN